MLSVERPEWAFAKCWVRFGRQTLYEGVLPGDLPMPKTAHFGR